MYLLQIAFILQHAYNAYDTYNLYYKNYRDL